MSESNFGKYGLGSDECAVFLTRIDSLTSDLILILKDRVNEFIFTMPLFDHYRFFLEKEIRI